MNTEPRPDKVRRAVARGSKLTKRYQAAAAKIDLDPSTILVPMTENEYKVFEYALTEARESHLALASLKDSINPASAREYRYRAGRIAKQLARLDAIAREKWGER